VTRRAAGPELAAPAFWQTLHYGLDPEGFFARARRRHGDLFTVRVLGETLVMVADPVAVGEVFAQGYGADSGEANMVLRALIGTRNVLLLDGEPHLYRRRLVLPAFHGERMRAYESLIRTAARAEVEAWPLGRPASALPRMQRLTFAVIMDSVFGDEGSPELSELGAAMTEILTWVGSMRRALAFAALGPDRLERLPTFRRAAGRLDRALLAEIARRRADPGLERRQDILSTLLLARDEDGVGLSDGELRDEIVTLLVAGHETTATLLGWALHHLARDAGSQERLAAEAGSEDHAFAEAAIAETLRLRPPVPLVVRRLCQPATIAGRTFPAGTTLAPCSLLVHRRADLYPDPWTFSPARFLGRRPSAPEWFPFGGSVRRCLGAAFAGFEARIVLEELLAALRFAPPPQSAGPERVGRRGPILVPARGARVIATSRR